MSAWHTPRVTLRRFTLADVELLVSLDSDPEVMRWLSGGPATPRDVVERDIIPRFVAPDSGYWAATAIESEAFIGWFSLVPHDPADFELGYRLRRGAWGKGYATEVGLALIDRAFAALSARRVFGTTYEQNAASRRVMEKLGMSVVERRRLTLADLTAHATYDAGATELWDGDDLTYAISREQWRPMNPGDQLRA